MNRDRNLIESMISLIGEETDGAGAPRQGSPYYDFALQIKQFIDEIPGGFFIYHADGDEKIIYANKALLRIFRCDTYEEFLKITRASFRGLVHPEDLDAVEHSIAEQIANSQDDLDYVEYRIVDKDGMVRWVEDYGHFVRSESAGDIYYVFISDATEKINRRMREKAALINEKNKEIESLIEEYDKERKIIRQEHLQRLEVIEGLSVNYDSILYVDLSEDKALAYRLSSRLQQTYDCKLQVRDYKWVAQNYVNTWVHPDDRERVAHMISPEYVAEKLKESPTYYLNYRCVQNGEPVYLQMRIVNVGSAQIVMGIRNIDEEVLQEIKQKQILQDALQNAKLAYVAKNTFLSNMSHDMRTPLNAIFGFATLAKKNLADGKAVKTYLDKIETAGRHILDLIEKVLDITYMESSDFNISEQACDLNSLLQEVRQSALPAAEQKNISIRLDTGDVQHERVYADSEKLKQALNHLASNAVKYTKCGGRVEIILTEQHNPTRDFSVYRFAVKDNGIGISKEALSRIFEPFEREQNTTLSGVYGSGLGLTIAKHAVEMMGGTIEAESEVNKGSTFTVSISFRVSNDAPASAKKEEQLDLTGKKILLVEDNEINLEIETEILETLGLTVDTAVNGKIAVEKVQAAAGGEYAFILMDIQMPVMNGIEASKAIRKLSDPARANVPIIALSANAFEQDKRNSMEAGIDAHIPKPLDLNMLIQTAKKILMK